MIHIASYPLLAALLFILMKKSRNPQDPAVLVAMFRDRNAIAIGSVWTIGNLVRDFVHNGLHGILNGLVSAMVVGLFAAAVSQSLMRRRRRTLSG